MKGLFKLSKSGQAKFQELFFPTAPQSLWRRSLLSTIVKVAQRSDRWLAARAPA